MTTKPRAKTVKDKTEAVAPLVPVDPSGSPLENATGYLIYKQVNLAQLQDEIAKAADLDSVTCCVTGQPDAGPVSEDNPSTLWIVPASIDAQVLAQVVADHVINPDWGVPDVLRKFNAALMKLQANPEVTLTTADKDSLIRGLALQFASIVVNMGSR